MSLDTAFPRTRPIPIAIAHRRPSPVATAWLIGLLATSLSLLGSWIPSLWGDEAASVLSAQRSLPSLFRMLGHVDAVHGLYYFGLHWWVALVGSSPFAVRLPSALAVGLGAVALVVLTRQLAGPRAAVIAGLVYCVLPRITSIGDEARAYAFDAAIAAWGLVLLMHLLRSRGDRRILWVAYAALVALGISTFLYLGLFVAVHAVLLVAARVPRSTWRRWASATALGILVASPVIVFAGLERSQVAYLADRNTTGFTSIAVGLFFTNGWLAAVAWGLIAVAAGSGIQRIVRARRAEAASSSPEPSAELVALAWLIVPGGLLLLSTIVVADFSGRYLAMSAPAAAMAIGLGIDRLVSRRALVGVALTAVVVALCVPTYLAQRTPYGKNSSDWAEISATVAAHAHPGQAVLFDEAARPSRRPRLAYRTYPAGFEGLADVSLAVPFERSTTWHDRALTVAQTLERGRLHRYSTVWLVEYATATRVDTYGISDLVAAGYSLKASYRTHRGAVLEFGRDVAPASASS